MNAGKGSKNRSSLFWISVVGAGLVLLLAFVSIFQPYLKAISMARAARVPSTPLPMPALLDRSMSAFDDWFVVSPIGDAAYAIGEPRYGQCNFAYLLVGKQSALLWDSGPGIRDISAVTRKLTSLPVTAISSHLHFDHVGGLQYFSDVALPDVADLRARTVDGHPQLRRFEYLGLIEGRTPPILNVSRWIQPGSEIDLGDRRVRILAAPGHTDNSIVLEDEATGNLFTGDTIYPGNVWAFLPGTDLHAFQKTVESLRQNTRPGAKLYGGHGCDASGPALEVPSMDPSAWESLANALTRSFEPSLTITLPRTIHAKAPITLKAKAPWMVK